MPLAVAPGPGLPGQLADEQLLVRHHLGAATNAPAAAAAWPGPKYLGFEASFGETLLAGGLGKVGWQRGYLLLGAAVADHRTGLGIGLGGAGRARGRFTPTLEGMYWGLNAPRDARDSRSSLLQLRPALAWQLKAGSRFQLVGGPTFNLGFSHRDGPGGPGANFMREPPLGQGQWLWLQTDNGPDSIRLWPGVQIGLRF